MWKLDIGVHKGTMMSRDSQIITSSFEDYEVPLKSLEDCVKCAKAWEQNYLQMGYMIWYARAFSPDGTRHDNLVRGHSYH